MAQTGSNAPAVAGGNWAQLKKVAANMDTVDMPETLRPTRIKDGHHGRVERRQAVT